MDEWTLSTLKEYLLSIITSHKEQHEASGRAGLMIWEDHRREHVAESKTNQRSADALSERLASMNEFRSQLRDQQATFVTREVIDQMIKALTDRIDANTSRIERQEGRGAGVGSSVTTLIAIISALAAAAAVVVVVVRTATGH